jgi:glycosyltransferase involved in cell wall biosynthesis
LKILYVDLETQWRGGQSQALLTVRGLRARGHDVQLVAVGTGELAGRANAEQIPVIPVRGHSRRWHVSRALRKLLTDATVNIVHTNEPHALTAAWLAKAHRRSKLVFSRRVAFPLGRGWIARQRYFSAARIFAISRFVAESVIASGLASDQVALVYEGVEIPIPVDANERARARDIWNLCDDDFVFSSVGYLLPEKGHQRLLRALARVVRENPRCKLLLAGDGPERRHLEMLAAGLGLRDQITFAGIVENIADVYRATDTFVFPSLAEPLGTSMLTAMAYGLPVIGVASGGVPEYVEAGVSGLLAKQPSEEALAAEMSRVLQNPELRLRLGSHARERISTSFSADAMVENTIREYERVISN